MEKDSEKHLLSKGTGGNGYYLPASTPFVGEMGGRAMNIDWVAEGDPVIFSVLTCRDDEGNEVDALALMNITGVAVSTSIRNFTCQGGFLKVTADKAVWLNLENKL